MKQVTHTVNVIYGSYYQEGIKITCNEDDNIDTVRAKVKKMLSLNFLPMATYSVKITSTNQVKTDY